MRKKSSSSTPRGLYGCSPESFDKDEPDWDYSYDPSGMQRDLSRNSSIESPWDGGFNSIVAPPSQQSSILSNSNKISTTQLSRLEILCSNHDCGIQQEPDSLYYQAASKERPKKRPQPTAKHRGQRAPDIPSVVVSERHKRDKNHIRKTMEQNLVHSAIKNSPLLPPSEIVFERQEETSPPPGCSMPALSSYFASTQFPSVVTYHGRGNVKDRNRTSPTSVHDIVTELTDLQDQLDALRMTKPSISREALVDAAVKARTEELVEFPELDEELMDGVPFQAYDPQREAPDSTKPSFEEFVSALHKHEPPEMEESFVDEGVRMRIFHEEESQSPDSSFSITIQEVPASPPRKPKAKKTKSMFSRGTPEPPRKEDRKLTSTRKSKKTKAKPSSSREEPTTPRKEEATRDEPEALKEQEARSPVPDFSKTKLPMSRSSPTFAPESPTKNKRPLSNSFSIRSAIASVRRPKTPTVIEEETERRKSVRFSKKLVSSLHYRPKTLPHEMDDLYFSKEELEELERDRDERIYEEQFEVVAGHDFKEVAVTYPVRRVELDLPRPVVVDPPTRPLVVDPPAPELADISGSWSSSSEAEQPQQQQQEQKVYEI